MKTALRLIGDGDEREKADFYPTPKWAVEALLLKETFTGNCWEPACGKGHISKVLEKHGLDVYSTDLLDYGFGKSGIDFLTANGLFTEQHKNVDNIITNPPFNLALEFIEMSKRFSNNKIAMFLKTTFLEGVERQKMWKDSKFRFKKMYQFSKRVSFAKEESNKNGGMISFAWFIWDKEYNGNPQIDWI